MPEIKVQVQQKKRKPKHKAPMPRAVTSVAKRMPKLRGRGGYWSDLAGDVWGGIKKVASYVPDVISVAKGLAPLLTGFGAYKIRKNSLLAQHNSRSMSMDSGVPTNPAPNFASKIGSDIVISHREYVRDIKSSIDFKSTTFPLNPGCPDLFPWLSQIANLYEEYEFLGMVFEYRSLSATAVGTTSAGMGAIITATDYDVLDTSFLNKRAMEAAEFSVSGVPYSTFIHPIECDPQRNVLSKGYVVPNIRVATDAPGDPRLSVLGNFTLATVGQQTDTDSVGELWVSYHIRLSRPILENKNNPAFSQTAYGINDYLGSVSIGTEKRSQTYCALSVTNAYSDGATEFSSYGTLKFDNDSAVAMVGRTFALVVHASKDTDAAWRVPIPPTGSAAWSWGTGSPLLNDIAYLTTNPYHRFGAMQSLSSSLSDTRSCSLNAIFTVTSTSSECTFYIPQPATAGPASFMVQLTEFDPTILLTAAQRTHRYNNEMRHVLQLEERIEKLTSLVQKQPFVDLAAGAAANVGANIGLSLAPSGCAWDCVDAEEHTEEEKELAWKLAKIQSEKTLKNTTKTVK